MFLFNFDLRIDSYTENMLKKIWRLFLGLVVCMGSACVTPTHASSAVISGVILTHIQAGITGDPTNEMVAFYNNTNEAVDITSWCLKDEDDKAIVCFEPPATLRYMLPAFSSAIVATESFLLFHEMTAEQVTSVFLAKSTQSGSLVGSGDTVRLVNAQGDVQDEYRWEKAAPSGKIAKRNKSESNEQAYDILGVDAGWKNNPLLEIPSNQVIIIEADMPDDDIPSGPVGDDGENQNPNPGAEATHPLISEVLPNPEGADTGREFIELYNPTDTPIALSSYQIRIGKNLEKSYSFPENTVIEPYSYVAFTNAEIKFSLLNTINKVQLAQGEELVGELVAYENPPDGASWARFENEWRYSAKPTPGTENIDSGNAGVAVTDATLAVSSPKPCASNQYRNPETNRCRLITAASSGPQPCKLGQERNPETNRCRSITNAAKVPAPCKEGQERNPETNRCRNIVKMTNAEYGVKGVATKQAPVAWYAWLGITGVVVGVGAYGVWEWRVELQTIWRRLRQKLRRGS